MSLRKRTNAYWQKRSTERVALLERQSEPYIRKVNAIYADAHGYDSCPAEDSGGSAATGYANASHLGKQPFSWYNVTTNVPLS